MTKSFFFIYVIRIIINYLWAQKKMKVFVLDLGTFCDFKLIAPIIKSFLRQGNDVVHITDTSNTVDMGDIGTGTLEKITYSFPQTFRSIMYDAEKANQAGDDDVSVFKKAFDPGSRAFAFYLRTKFANLLKDRWTEADVILVHYPAMVLLPALPKIIASYTPIMVFYVAPAYPNFDIPWVFSSMMEIGDFRLRDAKWKQENYKSHLKIIRQNALLSYEFNYLQFVQEKVIRVAVWDDELLPFPKIPQQDIVIPAGALLDQEAVKNPGTMNDTILNFIQHKDSENDLLIYITFGSFALKNELAQCLILMLSSLLTMTSATRIILHDTKKSSLDLKEVNQFIQDYPTRLLVYTEFIQHEAIVPKCNLIITTGSICLANIALYHGIPLLHVPLLREQYMWAKNYEQQCGVPYIDPKQLKTLGDEEFAEEFRRSYILSMGPMALSFVEKVSHHMHIYNGVDLLNNITTLVYQDKQRLDDKNLAQLQLVRTKLLDTINPALLYMIRRKQFQNVESVPEALMNLIREQATVVEKYVNETLKIQYDKSSIIQDILQIKVEDRLENTAIGQWVRKIMLDL